MKLPIGLIIYIVVLLVVGLGVMVFLERPRSRHRLNKKIKKDDWFEDKEKGLYDSENP